MLRGVRAYMKHVRMVSRNAQLFLLGAFFIGIGQGAFFSMANLYFEEMGFTRAQIGSFRSIQQFGTVLMAIPTALLITKYRAKTVLVISVIIMSAGYLGQAFGQSFGAILAFCGMLGSASGVINLSMAPLFMRSSTPRERVYLFGLHRIVRMVVAVAATLLAGQLIANLAVSYTGVLGYRYVLAGAGALTVLGVIPFLFVRTAELSHSEENRRFNLFRIRNKRTILKVCAPEFMIGAGSGLFIPFVNLYFKDVFGAGPREIAGYMSAARIAMVVGFVAAPLIARRFGMLRSVVATELLSIPFFAVMALWSHFGLIMIVFAYVARQSLMNMTQPLAANFALEVVPPGEQAITNSMKLLVWNGGRALFTFFGGFIVQNYGFKPVILGTAAMYLCAALFYLVFFRKHPLFLSRAEQPRAAGMVESGGRRCDRCGVDDTQA